jgi:hypothetical protein
LIEKFNFYDIYGYFLPGAAFLAVLWIPLGLVRNSWPSHDWGSALIAAVFAYIVGHLIQSVATNAIPSWKAKSTDTNIRYPSDIYLDATNSELPMPAKQKINELMKAQFGLNLRVDQVGDSTIDKVRNNAFLLARQILIQGKAVSYAEQFQGMYALTRGLVSVFALASAYWLGWAAAIVKSRWVVSGAVLVMVGSVLILMNISAVTLRNILDAPRRKALESVYALFLLISFFTIGYALGIRYTATRGQSALLAFLAAWALIASFRAYGAYSYFAGRFASTVWRDYLAYNIKAAGVSSKPDDEEKH